jgi:hypothetical protein
VTDFLAEEEGDGASTMLLKGDLESFGNGVFARVVETGQEDCAGQYELYIADTERLTGETLLRTWRV